MSYDYIFEIVFGGLISAVVITMLIWAMKCNHDWEEVLRSPGTVIYRCAKCGKEKRYEL